MKYTLHNAEPSQESLFGVIVTAIFGILVGWAAFIDWQTKRKQKQAHLDELAAELAKNIKREQLVDVTNKLLKLDDATIDKILDIPCVESSKMSPTELDNDVVVLKTCMQFVKTAVHPFRMGLFKLEPKDIAKETPVYKEYVDTFLEKTLGEANDFYPTAVAANLKKIGAAKKTSEVAKSFKELGWNKSTLKSLVDHVLYQFYDFPKELPWYKKANEEYSDAMHKNAKAIATAAGFWDDWDGTDAEKTDNMESQYLFGQGIGFFLDDPYYLDDAPVYQSLGVLMRILKSAEKYIKNIE